ncbi:MAG: carbamoyl-phosphate synthase small subunit [Candidatus Tokpelaia sp. JSC161]|jgi:carbamoyl-phosphate synthase small subunit|nr:MAG: carbamoyl-phosphate synthase small subunit [Candidatus Tokpelaia sp. JSC161]
MSEKSSYISTHKTAIIVLENEIIIKGNGLGATGTFEGEICFNTACTGYEEILTDPSYTGQIITFTFPHIGNVGINNEDLEHLSPHTGAVGAIFKANISHHSNYRATERLDSWLKKRGIVGLSGVDTRALTGLIRKQGFLNAIICYDPSGNFNINKLKKQSAWPQMNKVDLAQNVSSPKSITWNEIPWIWNTGYRKQQNKKYHILVIDYGVKRNILRLLASLHAQITIIPYHFSEKEILKLNPDGVCLSNGPGDPILTSIYATPIIQKLLKIGIPLFGICLGHQLLALATGAQTIKMHQGHHGCNHPVKDIHTGKIEIVSMNHGFAVDAKTLPKGVEETHISLFDGSNCGIRLISKPAFSVQYHPEASPGPQDSHYLFLKFFDSIKKFRKNPQMIDLNQDEIG